MHRDHGRRRRHEVPVVARHRRARGRAGGRRHDPGVAGAVRIAAHDQAIGPRPEVARAHLGVGLEASRGEHHGPRLQPPAPGGRARHDAGNGAAVAADELQGGSVEEYLASFAPEAGERAGDELRGIRLHQEDRSVRLRRQELELEAEAAQPLHAGHEAGDERAPELRVAARYHAAQVVMGAGAPEGAAGEGERAARRARFLEQEHARSELLRAQRRHQARHAGAGDDQVRSTLMRHRTP